MFCFFTQWPLVLFRQELNELCVRAQGRGSSLIHLYIYSIYRGWIDGAITGGWRGRLTAPRVQRHRRRGTACEMHIGKCRELITAAAAQTPSLFVRNWSRPGGGVPVQPCGGGDLWVSRCKIRESAHFFCSLCLHQTGKCTLRE